MKQESALLKRARSELAVEQDDAKVEQLKRLLLQIEALDLARADLAQQLKEVAG